MNNKIFRLWLKMTNKLSGSLKLVLAIVFSLLFNIAFADAAPDFTKPENYLPGKKYRVYGQGRGQVVNLRGGVHLSGGLSSVDGSFGRETGVYDGKIQYEQVFNDHPYWEHGPFDSSQTAKFSNRFATVGDGFIVNKVTIKARELHPADGYDGEPDPNGRFPSPTGARDEYTYEVHGTSAKIKPVYPDKPKPLPETPNREPNWSDNEPFSEPLSDRDIERIQEYLDTHPNAEGLPDSVKDAKQPHDFDWTQGNWESAEVGLPESEHSIADAIWGGLKELAAGARDYQADGAQYGVPVGAWGDGNQYAQPDPYAPTNSAEQLGANVAAIGSVIGARSPTSLGRNVAKHADDIAEAAATAARKVEKTTDAATDVAGATTKLLPNGQSLSEFEKSLSRLPAGERVAEVKTVSKQVAQQNGWQKNNQLTTKNGGRDIYTDSKGNHYALDTQHGNWEMLNKQGKHQGVMNFDGSIKPNSKDLSGGHDIRVK